MDLFGVLGPVMVGPSSSHTAGAARIGLAARAILGAAPERADITLYDSFAATGRGHGTDRALVAGLLGMQPDDPRIPRSLALAGEAGLSVSFLTAEGAAHPNTARVALQGGGRSAVVTAASTGGGRIVVTEVDGLPADFTCERPTLLIPHRDEPGCVAAVAGALAAGGVNIAGMTVHRDRRGGAAIMIIETDQPVQEALLARLAVLPGLQGVRAVPALS